MEEVIQDFEIIITTWLKSGDENVTNLAQSLVKNAESKLMTNLEKCSNCDSIVEMIVLNEMCPVCKT
jgi:rubrerythrin